MSHQVDSPDTGYQSNRTKQYNVSTEKFVNDSRDLSKKQSANDLTTTGTPRKETVASCNNVQNEPGARITYELEHEIQTHLVLPKFENDEPMNQTDDFSNAPFSTKVNAGVLDSSHNEEECYDWCSHYYKNICEESVVDASSSHSNSKSDHGNNEGTGSNDGEKNTVEGNGRRVGPCSKQMLAIHRMISYLEIVSDDGNNDSTDGKKYKMFLDELLQATTECTELHNMGLFGYDHLPGAIFERIVQRIDGTMFLRVYHDSKTYNHPRLNEIRSQANGFC